MRELGTDTTQGMPATPERSEQPHLIGERYEVVALLGEGAMGSVYEVCDRELDEHVALKLMRRELATYPGLLERFRQEVRLARKVTSPHVARVFDIGEHQHERFLTMELVVGESLGDLLSRTGALAPQEVVRYATAICDGLAAAHDVGVVHCDLKPDNVLLGRDGTIKLADFGIARAQADIDTARGTIAGTPAYMAPEQVTGEGLDARSDLYALGVMLFEMLTGDIPWKGPNVVAVASARLLHDPPDVRQTRPELPAPLADLVMRCMARRPAERPESAAIIGRELVRAARQVAMPSSGRMRVAPRIEERSRRVAVLPLRSASPSDDLLADGFTDDLISVLATARGLRVRARGTVMRYRGLDVDPREIGRELDVHVVVEGSVMRSGDRVTVLLRLIGVEEGFAIGSFRVTGAVTCLLPLADEAGASVARALAADVVARGSRPIDPEALDLLLRGRRAYHLFTRESSGEAVHLLRAAHEREPNDPVILATLASALLRTLVVGSEPNVVAEAETHALAALEQGPMLSEAHLALARVFFSKMDEVRSAEELCAAVQLSPSNAEAQALFARALAEAGALEQGTERLRAALEMDDRMLLTRVDLARLTALGGNPGLATEMLESPELASTYLAWLTRIRFALWERDVDAARALVCELRRTGLESELVDRVISIVESGGGERVVPSVGTPRRHVFEAQLVVEANLAMNRPDVALDALDLAVSHKLSDITWVDHCPLLVPLRPLARFAAARAPVEERARLVRAALLARIS